MQGKVILEVACGNMASVHAAVRGGADRIELCAALGIGGLTPSLAFIIEAIENTTIPVAVMVRPREGDFLYDEEEFKMILGDIRTCREVGAAAVVTGFLNSDGTVDEKRTAAAVAEAGPMEVVFHRAFDLAAEPAAALNAIIQSGCKRLLTSGMMASAPAGIDCIRDLVQQASGRISIMAGAGVNPENVVRLVAETGVREVHLSGKRNLSGGMAFRRDALSMGSPGNDEYTLSVTDEVIIRKMRSLLDSPR